MSEKSRLLLCLSDTHIGSSIGLCPLAFSDVDEGPAITANVPQKWLHSQWRDLIEVWWPGVAGSDPWTLVLCGDLLEGIHHNSIQVVSQDPAVHARMAVEVLGELVDLPGCQAVYVVRGTECHVGTLETDISYQLGGIEDQATGSPVHDHLMISIAGCLCSFQHHISTSTKSWSGGNALQSAIVDEGYRCAAAGIRMPDVIVRAHRHQFGWLRTSAGACLALPCFQLLTKYAKKVVQTSLAEVGAVALDWRDLDDGEIPIVRPRLYRTKPTPIWSV